VTEPETRTELLRKVRTALADLVEEGVEAIERPSRVAATGPFPAGASSGQQSPLVFAGEYDPSTVTDRGEGLGMIRAELGECTRCRLHAARQTIVFGEGNPEAPVVFVGEGPGAEEDRTGRPFVGRAAPAGEPRSSAG
jgi:DNA polymerase